MAIIDDNRNNMSSKDIKDILINTFKRTAEKSVHEANYDKTILATIQYCSDASIGQYKIKYQNGYFTAYSKDLNTVYSDKAPVYVVVPGNDMSNRMFITGLASDDSTQRTSVMTLEGDQQYKTEGKEFITNVQDISMLSYDGSTTEFYRTLYQYSEDNSIQNLIQLEDINMIADTVRHGGGYLRFGASFRTAFREDQKYSAGNYGIIIKVKYDNVDTNDGCKTYILDTFNMKGNPFEFTSYMPQYCYWEIDAPHFVRIESIQEFCIHFNPLEEPLPEGFEKDIFIKDLSLHSAYKVYDVTNNTYAVVIDYEKTGNSFISGNTTESSNLVFSAFLRQNGNDIKDNAQNLQYYWAKEDASVDNVNHCKYNEYTGMGWYCLNTAVNKSAPTAANIQDYKDSQYVIESDEIVDSNIELDWYTNQQTIEFRKSLFPGKKTKIKCVIVYENTPYEDYANVRNPDGWYVVLNNENSNVFYNGQGYATITAGVFKDNDAETPDGSDTLASNISYKWVEISSAGIERSLPIKNPSDILLIDDNWSSEEDNETKKDEEVNTYFSQNPGINRFCLQRYNYYNKVTQNPNITDPTYQQRAHERKAEVQNTRIDQIYDMYTEDNENSLGYYILGPTAVTGKYKPNSNKDPDDVIIDTVNHYYVGTTEYNNIRKDGVLDRDRYNTLYHLKGANVGIHAKYKVSALRTENGVTQAIGTNEITLSSQEGADLDYTLQIENGSNPGVFHYDETGLAPTSTKANHTPLIIKPLSFKIYSKEKTLLYDSLHPEDYPDVDIATLKPVWSFYKNECSLLKTSYEGGSNYYIDSNNPERREVRNEAQFYYTLREEYNVDFQDRSNIVLKVSYKGSTLTAQTAFHFDKEGDLGTNGTGVSLKIDDTKYNSYRDNILARDRWCKFNDPITGEEYYGPMQRHLQNVYLYATHCFDDAHNEITDISAAKFVDLQFADHGNDEEVEGSQLASFCAYLYQNGTVSAIDSNSKWGIDIFTGKYQQHDFLNLPSFKFQNPIIEDPKHPRNVGSTTTFTIVPTADPPNGHTYKPTMLYNFLYESKRYERVSNNLIGLETTHAVASQVDPTTGVAINRTDYGYYPIPYFYFAKYNSTQNQTPSKLDPARHIVIVGGYDSVVYDSAGRNPSYNQQNPFKIFLFDTNNKDITQDFLQAVAAGNNAYLEWTCSNGFTIKTRNINAPAFASYSATPQDSLYGKYCLYEGKYYKCITNHTYSHEKITIPATGVTYDSETFIPPYWKEVNYYREQYQNCELVPNDIYETLATANVFNSWIAVRAYYKKSVNEIYEAEALIPINVIVNAYGSQELNQWDGKKTVVDDAYILSSKIAAGVKEADNKFTGITIGSTFYPDNPERKAEVGLFGYSRINADEIGRNTDWARTIFMDAHTGRTILGPTGASQIVLNPCMPEKINDESWSRLAGWYFSPNFLYKPIAEEEERPEFDSLAQGCQIRPPVTINGSAGMYVPWGKNVTADDVFMWVSAKQKDLDLDDIEKQLVTEKNLLSNSWGITFNSKGEITNQLEVELNFQDEMELYHQYNELMQRAITRNIPCDDKNNWDAFSTEFSRYMTEEQYVEFIAKPVHDIEEDEHKDWQQAAMALINRYENHITSLSNEMKAMQASCTRYTNLLSKYGILLNSQDNGKIVSYKDWNNKDANWYVTYGGHMHASSVDVEGNVIATTGSFGTGSNRIQLSITKNGENYVLWSPNFWIKDKAGDPDMYMKGTIRAKSGQFGKVGDDKDGRSTGTVFIAYSWYPWHLPASDEEWSTLKLDEDAGRNTKYALYHKNFYIKDNGEVYLGGDSNHASVYVRKGRIGDWSITTSELKDINGHIVLHPAHSPSDDGLLSWISLGHDNLRLYGDGSIDSLNWSIDKNGKARFSNSGNHFVATTFMTPSGDFFGRGGLVLNNDSSVQIGNQKLHIYANGGGMEFSGDLRIDGDIYGQKSLKFPYGGRIEMGPNATDALLTRGGLNFGQGADPLGYYHAEGMKVGKVKIDSGGMLYNANILAEGAGACHMNGRDIPNYIRQVVNAVLHEKGVIRDLTTHTNSVDGVAVISSITITRC